MFGQKRLGLRTVQCMPTLITLDAVFFRCGDIAIVSVSAAYDDKRPQIIFIFLCKFILTLFSDSDSHFFCRFKRQRQQKNIINLNHLQKKLMRKIFSRKDEVLQGAS